MENKESTSGYVEDLVRCFVQLSAMELHAKTAVEKAEHAISIADDDDQAIKASDNLAKEERRLTTITEERRSLMRILASFSKEPNMDRWCEVKHSAMAMITIFEVYQANPSNEISRSYFRINNLFIDTMSDFLGFEILPCAACFSDALKEVSSL